MRSLDCLVCWKETEQATPDLCPAHARALDSVKKAYEVWATAYGSLLQDDFLKRIANLEGTGKNAREIVEFVQYHPEKWK